jgi:predicted nucleic acid-binding protein
MKALIDTNVVLDYLAKREPFLESAEAIFDAGKSKGALPRIRFQTSFIF